MTGNLKYDIKAAAHGPVFEAIRSSLSAESPLLVAGSTLEGEEAHLLTAWSDVLEELPSAVLLLAPRHTPRFAAVLKLAEARGFKAYRASALPFTPPLSGGDVIVLDTIGDLAGVYALATAAFLGGSLIPAGGHNPLEPARFGVPVIMGPSFENFREIVAMMQASNAIRVLESGAGLAEILCAALRPAHDIRELGERGRAVYLSQAGATARILAALAPLLPSPERPA